MSIVHIDGTVALFFANLLGKVFGGIYRIPLSNFLGAEGMGLYQMAFPIYSFLLTFVTGGISVSLTRKIAISRANNNTQQIYKDFYMYKKLTIFLGLLFFACLLAFAYPATIIQGNTSAIWGYFGIACGFVFASLLGVYRGYWQGHGNMIPTAISQIIEQITKLILGLLFASVLAKFGIVYGVFGATLGVSVGEVLAYVYFRIINRKTPKVKVRASIGEYRSLFKQCLPISISYGMLPLSSLIDSFLIVNLLTASGFLTNYATSLYGLETGMILPLINIPNVLISAIAISAIPMLTFEKARGGDVSKTMSNIFKTAYVFILPCCFGMFLLAKPIITFLYPTLTPQMLTIATNLLKFSVFEMFFLCFVTISNSALMAMGKSKMPIYSLGVGIAVKVILCLVFVTNGVLNIYGLVLASAFGYFITSIVNTWALKKQTKFNLSAANILSPIFSCLVMTAIILMYLSFAKTVGVLGLGMIVVVSVFVYFLILILLKQIYIKDLKKLLQNTSK